MSPYPLSSGTFYGLVQSGLYLIDGGPSSIQERGSPESFILLSVSPFGLHQSDCSVKGSGEDFYLYDFKARKPN